MTSQLPAPAPAIQPGTEAYWEAGAADRLALPRCLGCGHVVWYPRAFCPECWSVQVEWFQASGNGTIYSYTHHRRGPGAYRDVDGGYVLAYVELAEGPRVLTNIVECDPATLYVGQPVRAAFHPTEGNVALLRFRPAA